MDLKKATKRFKDERETLSESCFRKQKTKTEDNLHDSKSFITKVLKNKIATLKTLGEETEGLEDNPYHIEQIVNDRTEFEIYCKTKFNYLS